MVETLPISSEIAQSPSPLTLRALVALREGNVMQARELLDAADDDWVSQYYAVPTHTLGGVVTNKSALTPQQILGVNNPATFFNQTLLKAYCRVAGILKDDGYLHAGFFPSGGVSGLFHVLRWDIQNHFAMTLVGQTAEHLGDTDSALAAYNYVIRYGKENAIAHQARSDLEKKLSDASASELFDAQTEQLRGIAARLDRQSVDVVYVMPSYNETQSRAEKAIASVLTQNGPYKTAVFFVDDGSTEGASSEWVGSVYGGQENVFFFRQENGGRAAARNAALFAIMSSRVPYVSFLDSSDIAHSDKTRVQVEFLDAHSEVDFVHAKACTVDHEYNCAPQDQAASYFEQRVWSLGRAGLRIPQLLTTPPGKIHAQTTMMRRTAIERAGYQNILFPRAQDWMFWGDIMRAGASPDFIDEYVADYVRPAPK